MKVSVIIPVYNAADRIISCLDSLHAQSFDDVELVLVDDHGNDGSMEMAKAYAEKYPDMRFVFADNEENKGPGAARNLGMQKASGEYIAFVDSDDTVEPDFCSSLYEAAHMNDAELAYCHISMDYPDGHSDIMRNPMVPDGEFNRLSFLKRYRSYFTTFLYKRQFLLDWDISFPNTRSAEDSCFLLCSLLACTRTASVDRAMYHYAIEESSISQKKDHSRWRNRLKSFRTVRMWAKSHDLYWSNFLIIEWLCFKKGLILSLRDLIANL